jgi:cell division protein FtsN
MQIALKQRGSTLIGFVIGLVVGLGIAVVVAIYLTNAPIPFVNKVQRPTENFKPGADGKLQDPNKPLYSQAPNPPPPPAKADAPKIESAAEVKAAAEKAAHAAAEGGKDEGSRFLLQAGAFRTAQDADSLRARLALLGYDARVYPIEQGGNTLYRVRLGPYGGLDDINRIRKTLAENNIDSQVVRAQ